MLKICSFYRSLYNTGYNSGGENLGVSKRMTLFKIILYRVILSVLDPKKCEYLKDYSLDFEHAYMTTYLAS